MLETAIQWLMSRPDGTLPEPPQAIAWHGRLMVLSWLVVMPAAVLVARYYKVTPGQDWPRELGNSFWFVWHRRLSRLTALLALLALAIVLLDRGFAPLVAGHVRIGWLTLVLMAVQIATAVCRGTHGGPIEPFTGRKKPQEEWPGDHYSMTPRRVVFEWVHKFVGYALILSAVVAIATGLSHAGAPRWMFLGTALLVAMWTGIALWLQSAGRCLDTYQAIWGLDPTLPGNRRSRAIGFGIRRFGAPTGQDATTSIQGQRKS